MLVYWRCKITLSNFPIGELHIDFGTVKAVFLWIFHVWCLYIGVNDDVHMGIYW